MFHVFCETPIFEPPPRPLLKICDCIPSPSLIPVDKVIFGKSFRDSRPKLEIREYTPTLIPLSDVIFGKMSLRLRKIPSSPSICTSFGTYKIPSSSCIESSWAKHRAKRGAARKTCNMIFSFGLSKKFIVT